MDWKKVIEKLLSGKYFLTVIAGIAFLYCVVHKSLPSEAIAAILMGIIMSYFQKKNGESTK